MFEVEAAASSSSDLVTQHIIMPELVTNPSAHTQLCPNSIILATWLFLFLGVAHGSTRAPAAAH